MAMPKSRVSQEFVDTLLIHGFNSAKQGKTIQETLLSVNRHMRNSDAIFIPETADEAELMFRVGMMYIQQHAPERLTPEGRLIKNPEVSVAQIKLALSELSKEAQDELIYQVYGIVLGSKLDAKNSV
jgi:hypothetical protein